MKRSDIEPRFGSIKRTEGQYGSSELIQALLGFFICAISIYKLSLFGRFKDWREYAVQFLAIGLVGSYATVANAAENSYTDQDSFAATAIQHSVGSSQDFATSKVKIDTDLNRSESENNEDYFAREPTESDPIVVAQQSNRIITIDATINVQEDVEGGKLEISVRRSGNLSGNVLVRYFTDADTDSNPNTAADFEAISSTAKESLYFGPDETEKKFEITIINDSLLESTEDFDIRFEATGGIFSNNSNTFITTVNIIDDDTPEIDFFEHSFNIAEDAGTFNGKITINKSLSSNYSFNLSVSDGTAVLGTDYTLSSNFSNRQRVIQVSASVREIPFSIQITDNEIAAPDKNLTLTLSNLSTSNARFSGGGSELTQTLTIVDEEIPKLEIVTPSHHLEDVRGRAVYIRLEKAITESFSFDLELVNGTALYRTDFRVTGALRGPRQRVNFSNGTTELLFVVIKLNNDLVDGDKTFDIRISNLSSTKVQLANGASVYSKTITIVDDESTILSITNSDFSIDENETFENDSGETELGETSGHFTLKFGLSRSIPVPVTFDISLTDGTAIEVSDYNDPTNLTITIPANSQTGSVAIPIVNDEIYETDETFDFGLHVLTGAKFAKDQNNNEISSGTITINNDEPDPVIAVTNTSFSFSEDDSNASLDITFTPALTVASSFKVTMSTLSGDTAVANTDFSAITNFKHDVNSGSTTYSVPIGLIDNFELNSGADKTFTITISDLVNLKFSDNAASKPYTITITDDEKILPTLSNSNEILNFAENDTSASLDFTLSKTVALPASINVAVANGPTGSTGAVSSTDFNITPGTKNIASGTGTTYSIPLNLINDANVEVNETFTITLSRLNNLEFADGSSSKSFTITIVDDDSAVLPTISVSDSIVVDENITGGKMTIDLTLSRPYHEDINIHYYTQHESASSSDFTRIGFETNSMVSFKLGQTRKIVEITILDDALPEITENFTVIFNSSNPIKFSNNSLQFTTTVKIVDDDSTKIGFATSSFYVAENGGTFNVKFNISRAANVTFDLAVSDGTAILNTDYTLGSDFINRERQVGFTIGNTEATVSIPITDNNVTGANKNFTITVSNISVDIIQFTGGESQLSQTVTIVDDESTSLSIVSGTSHTVAENVASDNYTVNVRLSRATLVPVSFDYALADISATKGTDYTEPSNRSLTIAAGSLVGSFTIPIRDDTAYEADEEFSFSITNLVGAKSVSGQSQGTIVITNDDSKPTISASNITIAENDPNPTLDITFDKEIVLESSFIVTTSTPSNTAVPGTDFQAISNVRQPFNNVSTYSIRLDLIDNDDINSGPNKTFTVTLSSLVNVQFSDNSPTKSYVITIVDDDATELSISNTNFKVGEEDSNFVVSVSLTSTHDTSVSFKYAFEDIAEEAKKGVDYTEVAENQRTVTIPPGTNRGSFSIPIISDTDYEGNEKFRLVLSELVGANFSTGSTISQEITILDDEGPTIDFDVAEIRVNEDIKDGEVEVKVKLSGPASRSFQVPYATNAISISESIGLGNIATSVLDFPRVLTSFTVGANVTEATFKVDIVNDELHESNELFVVELRDVSHPQFNLRDDLQLITKPITIVDDDTPKIEIVADSDSFNTPEDVGTFRAKLKLSEALSTEFSLDIALTNGTAFLGTDYENLIISSQYLVTSSPITRVRFRPGITEIPISIAIMDDVVTTASDLTFDINLTNLSSTDVQFSGGFDQLSQTVNIVDDESTIVSITNTDLSFDENETIVNESGVSVGEYVVNFELSRATTVPVRFNVVMNDVTTSGTADYSIPGESTVTIAAGETEGSFSLPIVNDAIHEATETFTITVGGVLGGNKSNTNGSITVEIVDDDAPFLVIPANPTPLLVPEDGGVFNYNLTFSKALVQPIKVWIETTNGTAIKNTDFSVSATHERTNITTDTLPVPFTAEDNTETGANKTFTFRITQMEGARFPEGVTSLTGTVTIVDDESTTLTLTNTEFFVEEDVAGENFDLNLELSGVSDIDVTFTYELPRYNPDIGFPVGYDMNSINQLTIPAGETTKTISIPIVDDENVEGNERFYIIIKNLIGAEFTNESANSLQTISDTSDGKVLRQNVVILDDNSPIVSISADTYSIAEDGGQFTFKVSVADYKSGIVRYRVFTESESGDEFATVDSDYSSFSVGGEFGRNTQEREHTITILDDLLKEGEETFKISLEIEDSYQGRLPKGSLTHSQTVTIFDDESTTLSVKNTRLTFDEDAPTPGKFIVKLGISRTIDVDTLVEYDLESLTATKSEDFVELPASQRKAKIIPNQSGVNFAIEITNDSKHEGNETFKVILKNPVAAVFESGDTLEFIITIVDDEDPTVEFPTTLSVAENVADDEIEVSVTLSGPSSRSIELNYETADDSAEMGEDYTFTQGKINFAPGVTEQTFTIPIIDDIANEGNQSFDIQFSVSIGDPVFTDGESTFTKSVTIVDNESPTLSIANTEFFVYEDATSGKYELELALTGARSTGNVELDFAVNGGTATNLIDFTNTSESVVITPGDTSYIVDIGIIDNAILDGNKTIRFNLSNLTGAVFAGGVSSLTRTVTIIEDDSTTFSLTTTNFRFDENLTREKFEVAYQLSKARAFDVSFTVSTGENNDTATKVQDYTPLENQIFTIEAGQTTGTFPITIINDLLNEGVETFTLRIEDVAGATIAGNADSIEKTLTIVDDEIPTLAFDQILSTGKIIEGHGRYDFQFNLNPVVNQRFTISAEFTDGTARRGHEFTTPEGGASISKTIESASASLTLPGFSIPQNTTASGNKTFNITLRLTQNNGVNVAVFPNGTATQTINMTIVDDESLTLSFGNSQNIRVDEDAGEVVVGYSIATAISSDITFSYTLANHTANKVLDFTEPEADERSITLSAGSTSGSFSIEIINDEVSEGEETFNINFSDITNAAFSGGNTTHTEPIRINENDLPTLTITNEDYSIAEDGGSLVVNLALSHASYRDVTYNVSYIDGTAKISTHYNQSNSDLRIPAGAITGMFSIPIVNNGDVSTAEVVALNRTVRENHTFSFSLNRLQGAHFSADDLSDRNIFLSRTVTILDDELPAITVTVPTTVAENVGVGEADDKKVIEVQYDIGTAVNWDVSFAYNFSGGTATKNVDYTESDNRIVTIRTGTTGGSFTIPIINDDENEGNETFNLILQLGSPLVSGGALRNAGASSFVGHGLVFKQEITIVDDEIPTLSLSNQDLTISESVGATGFVANFSLSGATNSIVRFDIRLEGGTAINGTDYTEPNPRNLPIPIGQKTRPLTIPIINDAIVEGSETFNIKVDIRGLTAKFANGTSSETYTITIHDDEQPTLSFATAQIIAVENVESEEIVVNVELNGITHQDITFNYDMTDITTTKGGDYLEVGTRVGRILAGQSTGTFSIPIADDLKNEGDETFTVTLSSPVGAIFANEVERISKTVTIQDNELPTISLTTEDFVVAEDVGSAGFVVNFDLSGPTRQAVTFNWNLTDDTAIEGEDYTETALAQQPVTFPPRDATAQSIQIPIINDSDNEGNHSFTLELSNFSGAVFETGQSTFSKTITIDDDELPALSIATTNLKVFEDVGSDGFVLEFELSGPTDEDVTFDFALSGGSATKNFDYTEAAVNDRRVTIAAGEMTSSISIPIIDDLSRESNETFNITLSNLNNAVFEGGSAPSPAITILDDDSNFLTFANTSFDVDEDVGSSGFVVNVELTTAPELDVTFDYDLIDERENSNYTAIAGIDFVEPANRTVTIPAGSRTGSFTIQILNDLEIEGSQVFKLDLLNIKGAKFTNRVSSITNDVTIIDDEAQVISIVTTNFNVSEGVGQSGFELELELDEAALDDVVITHEFINGSATEVADFNFSVADETARAITIAEGETRGTIVIAIIDDTEIEASENFRIQLRARGDGYPEFDTNIGSKGVDITILDNDAPILSISDGPSVEEPDTAVFTISSIVQPANNNFPVQYVATNPDFVDNSGTKQTSHPLDFGDADGNGIYTAELRVEIASDISTRIKQ